MGNEESSYNSRPDEALEMESSVLPQISTFSIEEQDQIKSRLDLD